MLSQKAKYALRALVDPYLSAWYAIPIFAFYPLFIVSLFFNWKVALILFGIRFLFQGYIFNRSMYKLGEEDLFPWWWLLDIWMFFYYIIFASTLWKKPRKDWK